jgi:hypothetical protein
MRTVEFLFRGVDDARPLTKVPSSFRGRASGKHDTFGLGERQRIALARPVGGKCPKCHARLSIDGHGEYDCLTCGWGGPVEVKK